jgi:hypothetical protein
VATLAGQVNDGERLVALLEVRYLQAGKLGTSQATTQEKGQNGMICFAFGSVPVGSIG